MRRTGWTACALVAGVLALYANSLGHGFHYDDGHSLVDNEAVRTLGNTGRFFVDPGAFSAMPEARMYRPLLLLTYALNHAVGGDRPFGYHLVNVLLHAANAGLLWLLARRLLGSSGTALAAALLFATHPAISETVDYVSARSSSLAALFVLGGLLVVVAGAPGARARQHVALTGLAALALLAKSEGIALLPLAALCLLQTRAQVRAWTLLAGPAVAAVAYVAGTRQIIGKAFLEPVRSAAVQLGTQVKAIPFYAHTCLMPVRLSIEPQFTEAHGVSAAVAASLALCACLAGAVVVLRRLCPAAASGAAWFAVTLAPSSVVPLNVLVNEHRLYLPLAGGAILAAALLGAAGQRRRWFLPALLALWVALVVQRNGDWASEEAIWGDAVRKGPGMPRALVNLGKAYLEDGRYDEAIAASQRALALDPGLARAHYNIGTAHLQQRQYEEAVASYERALELEPHLMEALNNLGNAFKEQGLYWRAIEHYRRALGVFDHASLHHNLGSAFLAAGEADSAVAHFERARLLGSDNRETVEGLARALRQGERLAAAAQLLSRSLRRWPDDAELLALLGATQAALGHDGEALAAYRRAGLSEADARLRLGEGAQVRDDWARAMAQYKAGLEAAPADARLHDALGTARYALNDRDGALAAYRRAAELDPTFASAFRHIGLVYLRHHRVTEALAALERARDLEGGAAGPTWELLARAYADAGRPREAIAAYGRALELEPGRAEVYHNLAALLETTGAFARAEGLYRDAIERDPRFAQAHFNLGHLLLEQRRYAEAAQWIEKAIALEPGSAEAYVNLASACLNLGRHGAAAAAYERFLELHPADDELRRKVVRQLELLRAGRKSSPVSSD